MTQEYYTLQNKVRKGPFDLVALVRKIRNGSVNAQTPLQQTEDGEPKAAQDWPELAEFFAEKKEEKPQASDHARSGPRRTFSSSLAHGWNFLQRNQYSTVYSGLIVLSIILIAAAVTLVLPPAMRPIGYMACFVFSHFMLSCYMLVTLRQVRGQPADSAYLKEKVGPAVKPLLLASLLISFPAYIGIALLTSQLPLVGQVMGLFIFAVPGLYMLALYVFTPLLILEQKLDFWEAMETSRKAVLKSGLENAGIIYALFVINFLAGLCVLIPLAIALPVTIGAFAEMYDETFLT